MIEETDLPIGELSQPCLEWESSPAASYLGLNLGEDSSRGKRGLSSISRQYNAMVHLPKR
jgi:hypothetical protein